MRLFKKRSKRSVREGGLVCGFEGAGRYWKGLMDEGVSWVWSREGVGKGMERNGKEWKGMKGSRRRGDRMWRGIWEGGMGERRLGTMRGG